MRRDKRGRILRAAEDRQKLIETFHQSGLGMAEFCRRQDLRLSTVYNWVHRAKTGRLCGRKRKEPIRFAEVKVAMGGGAPIEVELPGGVRIQVRDASLWPVVGGWLREVASC
jgi:transposase-like protein